QAVTLRLLTDGAIVAVPYAVEDERKRLIERVAAADHQRLIWKPTDVIHVRAMAAFADGVVAARGKIDILVAGVGGFAGGSLLETDLETWTRMLDLNLTSVFSAAKAVVPAMMRARYGRVVVVASRAVVPPAGGFIAYTAAKAGAIAFTQALSQEKPAREGLPRRIRSDTASVQSISGFVRSDSEPGEGPMKPLTTMATAAVILALGYSAADAQNGRAIRQDQQDVRQDRRELHRDTRDIRQDRRELAGDRRELSQDIKAGRADEVKQDRAEIRGDRRDLNRDRRDLRNDQAVRRGHQDVRQDRRELARDNRDIRQDRREL